MSAEPQLFRIDPETRESESITEVEFAQLGLQERRDIQEWVAGNPEILGDDLLIIAKEFSAFDRTNERLDLLAVDSDGTLVVIELKRDDSGADVHWQAVKYASYLNQASIDDIISILANYLGNGETHIPEDKRKEAENTLLEHLGAEDLSTLNSDQRIILASHTFAPEVTTAVLWLNEKAPVENLITCVKLIPFKDREALYLQAHTIIPAPTVEIVGIGDQAHDLPSRPIKKSKRPRLKFGPLGIQEGEVLTYVKDDTITAKVVDGDSNVEYQGEILRIAKLTTKLLNSPRPTWAQPYWRTETGELLSEMYDKTYPQ